MTAGGRREDGYFRERPAFTEKEERPGLEAGGSAGMFRSKGRRA